ncbi:hypothetical protein BRARA_I01244 [Brassica rapa]|uniref:Calponin-homology (CH) domain-containing protein n=1 Tax=Brassica campestris TaxID=3711 RepID=A0A397XYD1_BRACM|nr:hypothetical protein BRARA_I01244 [Brassica rapa]
MNINLEQDANMSGIYAPSDATSFLSFDGSETRSSLDYTKKGHQNLVEWLNQTLPYLNLPSEASEDEVRACLRDGTVLCNLLNQLSPGSMKMGGSFEPAYVKIERFLTAMDEMALPSKHSDSGSPRSSDELKLRKDLHQLSKFAGGSKEIDIEDDIELIGLGDADSEDRLSDISDSCLSMGTETDGSISSAVELTLFPETVKPLEITEEPETHLAPEKPEKSAKTVKTVPKDKTSIPSKIPKQTLKPPGQTRPSRLSIATSSSSKALTSAKRPTISTSTSMKPLNRRR